MCGVEYLGKQERCRRLISLYERTIPIVPHGFIVDFDYWLNCFLDAHASSGSQNPTQDSDLSQVTVTRVFCILRTRRITSWLA